MRAFTFCAAVLAVLTIATAAQAKVQTKTVVYSDGATKLEGNVAWDDSVHGDRPGILIVHQWKGLSDYEKKRAAMVAQLGYVAFACDIYGQGVRPQTNDDAGKEAGKYRNDPALFRERLTAGLDELKQQPHVDVHRLAAIGYCFGGGGVLELARSGADLAGVVSFHGALGTSMPAQKGAVKCKVLACCGADDPTVPPSLVQSFEDEMRQAGADWELVSYGNTVHAFTDWSANTPGMAMYNAESDRRSWALMQDFLREIFPAPAGNAHHGSRH
jgi:dienelactone hydrolase